MLTLKAEICQLNQYLRLKSGVTYDRSLACFFPAFQRVEPLVPGVTLDDLTVVGRHPLAATRKEEGSKSHRPVAELTRRPASRLALRWPLARLVGERSRGVPGCGNPEFKHGAEHIGADPRLFGRGACGVCPGSPELKAAGTGTRFSNSPIRGVTRRLLAGANRRPLPQGGNHMSSRELPRPVSAEVSDRYRTFRGREPAAWLAEFREAGWPDLASAAVTSFLMGARPVPPGWKDEMMPAESRQADAVASGATATIAGQIASLGPRPTNGYFAEAETRPRNMLVVALYAVLALVFTVAVLRTVGEMEYRRSVSRYCMSGPATRCPDYPRLPGKFSYEIDPDVPAQP